MRGSSHARHHTCHAYTRTEYVLDVDWCDNESLASCSGDHQIHSGLAAHLHNFLADILTVLQLGRTPPVQRIKGHHDEVNVIRFDPSRHLLASGSDDKTVRIWSLVGLIGPRANDREPEEGEDVDDLDCRGGSIVLRGHQAHLTQLTWLPGSGVDGKKRVLASCVHLAPLLGEHADGPHSGDQNGIVKLWNIGSSQCTLLYNLERHSANIYGLAFRPAEGDVLAVADSDGRVTFWLPKVRSSARLNRVAIQARTERQASCRVRARRSRQWWCVRTRLASSSQPARRHRLRVYRRLPRWHHPSTSLTFPSSTPFDLLALDFEVCMTAVTFVVAVLLCAVLELQCGALLAN